jgi:hypothetical protein
VTESSGDPRQDSAVQADTTHDTPEPESGRAGPDPRDADHAEATPEPPESLTFRITPVTLLVVIVLAVCMTPVAWVQPWTPSIYVIPLALFAWVLRTRTVVDRDVITARTFRTTRVPWDSVQSFRVDQRRWLRAVLRDDATAGHGREVLLPAVRVRDLPRLAAMSGGRLPDFDTERDETSGSPAANSDSGD